MQMRIKRACYGYECKNIISIYCHNNILIMWNLPAGAFGTNRSGKVSSVVALFKSSAELVIYVN